MRIIFLIQRRNSCRLPGPIVKFIGLDDGKSSDRVLDAVQSLVERGSQR